MWPCLRVVKEGWATMTEVNTTLSVDDVEIANSALDSICDARERAHKKAQKASEKGSGR